MKAEKNQSDMINCDYWNFVVLQTQKEFSKSLITSKNIITIHYFNAIRLFSRENSLVPSIYVDIIGKC